jgi:aspartyl protease family protein
MPMLKHAAILVVAVLSALISAQGLVSFAAARASSAEASAEVAVAGDAPIAEPMAASGEVAQITKAADGHYWAQAQVNGRWVKFLVDTGASAVALTGEDARRLGIDLDSLDYVRPVITANGMTKAATITLDHVMVGGARLDNVQAMVVPHGLPTSLLGMSYLGRLSRFEATRTALILRP